MTDLIEQARDIGAWLDGHGYRTMADMMEAIAAGLEDRVDKAQAWDAATAVPRKTADELSALRERVEALEAAVERAIRQAQNIGIDSGSYYETLLAARGPAQQGGEDG